MQWLSLDIGGFGNRGLFLRRHLLVGVLMRMGISYVVQKGEGIDLGGNVAVPGDVAPKAEKAAKA